MSKLSMSLCPFFRLICSKLTNFIITLVIVFFFMSTLYGVYIPVYTTNTNGGMSWTGNTLGLSKQANNNEPGIRHSIGAFITTNTLLQVGLYPPGTTLNWTLNSSSATLDIPAGSTILHAELIWSGSYGYQPAISGAVLNTPVTFIPPSGIPQTITPNPLTAQSYEYLTPGTGFYVRSADVTSFVSGGGVCTVGGVPGTVGPNEDNYNCAGWTLAVAYQNPNMLSSNLSILTACEQSGSPPASITGFTTPLTGTVSSRLFVCGLEGDVQLTGDSLLIGPSSFLTVGANGISGGNNPLTNFFCSQINTLLPLTTEVTTGKLVAVGSSSLDTRGSFGLTNADASTSTPVSGARQGYDITSIDISSNVVNGQQQMYVQGTTAGEVYTITGLGLQIQQNAPIIVANKQVSPASGTLNTVLTFTSTFTNVGQSLASSVVFQDILAAGLTYVPGSFTINGVPFVNPNLNAGVPLGNLVPAGTFTVVFNAQITSLPVSNSFNNFSTVSYLYNPFNDPTPVSSTTNTNTVTVTTGGVTPPVATPDTASTIAGTILNGTSVLNNDTGTQIVVSVFDNTSVQGGSVSMQPNGIYIYTPPSNFSGIDTFNYTISDIASQTSSTTVTITVFPIANADSATVAANTPLNQLVSVLNNDLGSGLTISSYDPISATGGTVVMQANGTYLYTPFLNFSGIDSFNYTITDSTGNSSSTVVSITVLPAAADDVGVTPANVVLNGSTVFTNDIGTGLTIIAYDNISTQGGSIVMNTLTGTYVFTPPLNFSGLDTFTYTVQDSSGIISVATVRITVLPVAVNDFGTITVNTTLLGSSVLVNDLGSQLSIFSYNSASVQGGSLVMNTLTGTYVYIPPVNYSGSDSFNYILQDGSGQLSGASVIITITPFAANDTASTPANTLLIGPSVLSNDSGTALSVVAFQAVSNAGGTVAMNVNGTYTYNPPLNFSGLDSFSYTAQDSSGSQSFGVVTITVLPLANDDIGITNANQILNGASVFLNDIGVGLSIAGYMPTSQAGGIVTMNNVTGTYVYAPPNGFSGFDTFQYFLTDSAGSLAIGHVNITVLPTTTPINESTLINTPLNGPSVFSNDIGAGLSIISYQQTSVLGGVVVMDTLTGTYTYTPPLNFIGVDSFTYTIIDTAGNEAVGTVVVTVMPVLNPVNPPKNFCGVLKKDRFFNKTDYRLIAKWEASDSNNIKSYRIYRKKKIVAEISAQSKLIYTACLKSKKPANLYSIVAVDENNIESLHLQIRFHCN